MLNLHCFFQPTLYNVTLLHILYTIQLESCAIGIVVGALSRAQKFAWSRDASRCGRLQSEEAATAS